MTDEILERFAANNGFDLCAPLDDVAAVIGRPDIGVNMATTESWYPWGYMTDLINGDQFFVQFFNTNYGEVACLLQVWGMFVAEVVLPGVPV